ncbi:MAG: hypothetical protein HYR60_07680 [Acidobacteria bacterium]|nr:hypothetical protein [Acidobacteriota bacterium]
MNQIERIEKETTGLPKYEPPKIRVMDEKEIFAAFQVSVNASTWWFT